MKLLICLLLCCSVHGKFAHSQEYLDMEKLKQEIRDQLTMEQKWADKFSSAQAINNPSESAVSCKAVKPQPGFGTEVPSAVTVCIEDGVVCHHTKIPRCCNVSNLLNETQNEIPGGMWLSLENRIAHVNFFYSGGGYGSGELLRFCYMIEGSEKLCSSNLLGCEPSDRCGPSDIICEEHVEKGTCNPDPNPDNGGGCQCLPGYLAPNCCKCDYPEFYERVISTSESICKPLCRKNCEGTPTKYGCKECKKGYKGDGCCDCDCEEGYVKKDDECIKDEKEVCEKNCVAGSFNAETGCSECQGNFTPPTCCNCTLGYIFNGTECIQSCIAYCAPGFFDPITGCTRCLSGWHDPPLCCREERCIGCECGKLQDVIIVLDYSTSFEPQELRGVLGNLQLISDTFRGDSDARDAVVHYKVTASKLGPSPHDLDSNYIYSYDSSCSEIVKRLDYFAGYHMEVGRSFTTESYSALKFIADNVPIDVTRTTTVITITDSYSKVSDNIERIKHEISRIKVKATNPLTRAINARFFTIGIDTMHTGQNKEKVRKEFEALAGGEIQNVKNVKYPDASKTLLNLLENTDILCSNQRLDIVNALYSSANQDPKSTPIKDYIMCSRNRTRSLTEQCAYTTLGLSCTEDLKMEEKKESLMSEILSAIQKIFFRSE